MYAIVTTGGKQVKVLEGEVFRAEKIDALVGETVELTEVRMVVKDDGIVVDPRILAESKVICRVVRQDRGPKIRVFKKKRKNNYTRTQGHRQDYTYLRVDQIVG